MERANNQPLILVIGATGGVGSVLLSELTRKHRVRAFTRKDLTLVPTSPQIEWIRGDVLDRESIDQAMEGVEIVFNTAGWMTTKYKDSKAHETNVTGLLNTALSCKQHKVPRFIHLSSVAVYGKQDEIFEEGREVITEENPQNAKSAYGLSKRQGEVVIQKILQDTWTIIRPANLIGKEMDVFTGQILKWSQRPVAPFFQGAQATFNYINVYNLVDLMIMAAESPKARDQIFNAVDGHTTWEDMVRKHAQAIGKQTRGLSIPRGVAKFILGSHLVEDLGRKCNIATELFYTGVSRRVYSAEKAQEVLGWRPRISLEDTMLDISQNYAL